MYFGLSVNAQLFPKKQRLISTLFHESARALYAKMNQWCSNYRSFMIFAPHVRIPLNFSFLFFHSFVKVCFTNVPYFIDKYQDAIFKLQFLTTSLTLLFQKTFSSRNVTAAKLLSCVAHGVQNFYVSNDFLIGITPRNKPETLEL